MKKFFVAFSLFFFAFLTVNQATAQSSNQAYWEQQAEKYIKKADRVINHYNKQTRTFSPQELRMMRTNPKKFTQLANARTKRYDASIKQYKQIYNDRWAKSFESPKTYRYVKDQYGNVYKVY